MSPRKKRKSKRLLLAEDNPRTLASLPPGDDEIQLPARKKVVGGVRSAAGPASSTAPNDVAPPVNDSESQSDAMDEDSATAKPHQNNNANDSVNATGTEDEGSNESDGSEDDREGSGDSSSDDTDVENGRHRGQFRGPHCIALMTSILDRKPHRAPYRSVLAAWNQVRDDVLDEFPQRQWSTGTLRRKVKALVGLHEVC